MFHGNYIDLIIIFLLLIWILDGWERGFFLLVAELIAFLGAFLFGLRFYGRAAFIFIEYFSLSHGIANALGFFMVYSIAHSIISTVLVAAMRKIPLRFFPKLWQKFLGIFPAAINGVILIAVILTLVVGLPIRKNVKDKISESEIGGLLIRKTNVLERNVNLIFGEAIKESLVFLTVEPKTTERVSLNIEVKEPELKVADELEKEMYALVNEEREKRGISSLKWDVAIVPVSRAHATDMFENGYFSHIDLKGQDVGDRLEASGIKYSVAGENLAFAPSLAIAHDGLMQSPGHRENILDKEFGRIGIGVIDGGAYGKMFVQVFAD